MTALCEGGIISACTDPQDRHMVANTPRVHGFTSGGIHYRADRRGIGDDDPEMHPNKVLARMLTSRVRRE